MITRINNQNFSFTSLNNPVKPFRVLAENRAVKFKEIDYFKLLSDKELNNLGEFFLDNFAKTSTHPFWEMCRKNARNFNKDLYHAHLEQAVINDIKLNLIEPDTTLMIGYDKGHKIVGAILANALKVFSGEKTSEVLYLNMLAVNENYRGNNIGKKLLKSLLESSKDRFKKTFLVAYKESEPFYKKQGFRELDIEFDDEFELQKDFAKLRIDYPEYASFLIKDV